MAKAKATAAGVQSFTEIESELQQLEAQIAEKKALLNEFESIKHQRQALKDLCAGLKTLALSDSIDQTETLKEEIQQGKLMIAAATKALGVKPRQAGAEGKTGTRRSSSDPSLLADKEKDLMQRQAKKHAGLIDSKGNLKRRLNPEDQIKYEEALAYLKKTGWTPAALIRAEEKAKAKAKKKA